MQDRLKELFEYSEGALTRKVAAGGQPKGSTIGNIDQRYIRARVDGKKYLLHRLIYVFHKGVLLDTDSIDHINGDCFDNRIENLHKCSHEANMRNTKKNKRNTSGTMGVTWYPRYGKWLARIGIGKGKREVLGYFDKKEDAVQARKEAEKALEYSPTHGRTKF